MIPSLDDLTDEAPSVRVEILAAAVAQAYIETRKYPVFGSPIGNGWDHSYAGRMPTGDLEDAGWLAREILDEHGDL